MPMIAERGRESDGERHMPQPSALRCRHLAVPVGSLNADLPLAEIDVAPCPIRSFEAFIRGVETAARGVHTCAGARPASGTAGSLAAAECT